MYELGEIHVEDVFVVVQIGLAVCSNSLLSLLVVSDNELVPLGDLILHLIDLVEVHPEVVLLVKIQFLRIV